MAAPGLGF